MKRAEVLKTVSKTNKMLKELFMGKPPASFKDDFFYFSLIFTLSRPWYFLNIITKNPTCLTQINPRTYTQSHTPGYPYRGTRGVMGPLPRGEFWYVAVFRKDFTVSGKPLIFSDKMRYILWVVTLLETCDVTKHGRHLGFYQE